MIFLVKHNKLITTNFYLLLLRIHHFCSLYCPYAQHVSSLLGDLAFLQVSSMIGITKLNVTYFHLPSLQEDDGVGWLWRDNQYTMMREVGSPYFLVNETIVAMIHIIKCTTTFYLILEVASSFLNSSLIFCCSSLSSCLNFYWSSLNLATMESNIACMHTSLSIASHYS